MARNPALPALHEDGRRAFYVYLQPELIRELKKAALDEERPAYALSENALMTMLSERRAATGGVA